MKKRVISLFLALTMLIGLAPAVLAADHTFTDVSEADWFYSPVQWAVENNITSGLSESEFGPNVTCTRGQVVTFLWAAADRPAPTVTNNPFTDVAESDWFYAPVLWAVENRITSGLTADSFGPNEPCTRAQVVTFLWAAAERPEPTVTDNPFTDVTDADWFLKPVLWAVENRITSGLTPDTFGANEPCTRGQIVTFLYGADKIEDTAPEPTPDEFTPSPEEQAAFEAKTIYDFPEHLVLNFDEDPETNFGVLNENVIRWEDKPITAEKIVDGEQTKYVFSDEAALKDLPIGSVVYVKSASGEDYLFSVGNIDGNTVTTDPNVSIFEYYTYMDVCLDVEIDYDAIATEQSIDFAPLADDGPAGWNNKLTTTPNYEDGVAIGGMFDSENFELGLSGAITFKTTIEAEWDFELFRKDYISFEMYNTTTYSVDLTGKVKGNKEKVLRELNEEIELGEIPLKKIFPGAELTVEIKIPVELSAEAGFKASIYTSKSNYVEYKTGYKEPYHVEKEIPPDVKIDAEGKAELKSGVAMELGVDLLEDKLEAVLELKLMGGVRIVAKYESEAPIVTPDSIHMCTVCFPGELFVELGGDIFIRVNVDDDTHWDIFHITLVKLEVPINAFYLSVSSPSDSKHEGKLVFGIGTCPNQKWRVTWEPVNDAGTPSPILHTIRYGKMGEDMTQQCLSNETVYLYDGEYSAATESNGVLGTAKSFLIKGFSATVKLDVPKDNDKKQISKARILENGKVYAEDTYYYNENGLLTLITRTPVNSATVFTEFFYDKAGRMTKKTVSEGTVIPFDVQTYTYNDSGLLVGSSSRATGSYNFQSTMTYEYDENNKIIRAIEKESGNISEYFYDEKGLVSEVKTKDDGGTAQWTFSYDERGRMITSNYSYPYSEYLIITYNYDYAPFTISVEPDIGEPYDIHSAYFTDIMGHTMYSYSFSDPEYVVNEDGYLKQVTDKATNRVYEFLYYPEESFPDTPPNSLALYEDILNQYKEALEDCRSGSITETQSNYTNINLELVKAVCSNNSNISNIGYALYDINKDGTEELLIGGIVYSGFYIGAIHTHDGTAPTTLLIETDIPFTSVYIYPNGVIHLSSEGMGSTNRYFKFDSSGSFSYLGGIALSFGTQYAIDQDCNRITVKDIDSFRQQLFSLADYENRWNGNWLLLN